MKLLPIEAIKLNYEKIKEIDYIVKSIYRLIIFSRYHEDDDLLDSFFNGMHELTELLSIKNAQMEAQNEEEAKEYLKNMRIALNFIVEEIKANRNFENEVTTFSAFSVSVSRNSFITSKSLPPLTCTNRLLCLPGSKRSADTRIGFILSHAIQFQIQLLELSIFITN